MKKSFTTQAYPRGNFSSCLFSLIIKITLVMVKYYFKFIPTITNDVDAAETESVWANQQ